jgi:hypothetical protein
MSRATYDSVMITLGADNQFEVALKGEKKSYNDFVNKRTPHVYRQCTHVYRHGACSGNAKYRVHLNYAQANTFIKLFDLARKEAKKTEQTIRVMIDETRWGFEPGQRDAYLVVEAGNCGHNWVPEQKNRLYNLSILVGGQVKYSLMVNGYSDLKDISDLTDPWAVESEEKKCKIEKV